MGRGDLDNDGGSPPTGEGRFDPAAHWVFEAYDEDEDLAIQAAYAAGTPVEQIAAERERTVAAIRSRLGLDPPDDDYTHQTPDQSGKQVRASHEAAAPAEVEWDGTDEGFVILARDLGSRSVERIPDEDLRTRMRMRFGTDGSNAATLEEVGRAFGVTRERIRQQQEKYLRQVARRARIAPMPEAQLSALIRAYIDAQDGNDDAGRLSNADLLLEIHPVLPMELAFRFILAVLGVGTGKVARTLAGHVLSMRSQRLGEAGLHQAEEQRRQEQPRRADLRLNALLRDVVWPARATRVGGDPQKPVRSVGESSHTGQVVSSKLDRFVEFESYLERDFIELLEHATEVVAFLEQPLSIAYLWRGQTRRYVPDFFVHLHDGRRVLVEVKSMFDVPLAINLAKFSAALDLCASRGWGFLVAEGRRSVVARLRLASNPDFEQHLGRAVADRALGYGVYRSLFPNVPHAALAAAIIRTGIDYDRPFRLSAGSTTETGFALAIFGNSH